MILVSDAYFMLSRLEILLRVPEESQTGRS
jgi:hypothetical protein